METGIYFNMPYSEYRDQKGLSYSGIKTLLQSPYDYWQDVIQGTDSDSDAMLFGRALHEYVLLGENEFQSQFIIAPEKGQFDGLLDTMDDLKKFLADQGEKTSGNKQDLINRVRCLDKHVPIWQEIKEVTQFKIDKSGQEVLAATTLNKIARIDALIKSDQKVSQFLEAGYPEVSVFWKEGGIQCKARFDYLQLNGITDLKKADPYRGCLAGKAANIICDYRYDLQAYLYNYALDQILKNEEIAIDGDTAQLQFINGLKEQNSFNRPFNFVMVQCDPEVPSIVTATLKQFDDFAGSGAMPNAYWNKCENDFHCALSVYRNYLSRYGYDQPWLNPTLHINITDADLPIWHLSKQENYYAV